MKRLILPFTLFLSFVCTTIGIAQTDSLIIKPIKVAQCGYTLTLKNRNAAQQSIDELRLEIVTADGTQWYPATAPSGWTAPSQSDMLLVNFTIVSTLLAPGTEKSGFIIELDETTSLSFDKPISVKWTTLNGTQTVSTGFLTLICTPFQSGDIDTVTVVPTVHNTDPCFNFTVFNKNENLAPISRVAIQLQTVAGGTMRPSKISPPPGWQLDSVTAMYAYFSALSSTDYIIQGENLGGFRVCLRGNPTVNNFAFNWFTYEEGGVLLGRDTVRNISNTFTGSAAEADSVYAAAVNGCLYQLTVKNYHVSNTALPSRIRRLALWSKTAGLTFTAAPSAPLNWTKVVKADSIIYTANHDSSSLPSSKVSTAFRFSVDPPNNDPFKIGWRTYKTLTEPLSTGELQLQCSEQPPLQDVATIENADVCSWNIRITNQHNTPASDLAAIELSIPAGSGTLSAIGSSLNWTKTNETPTSVRFVAPTGDLQETNIQQLISFMINPQTPGQTIVLTWKTYDEAAVQSNTPIKTDTFQLACTPVVILCDLISAATEAGGDTCLQNFTIKSQRSVALTGATFEPQNGWKIDTAFAPAGWDVQLDANKTLVNYTNSTGIAPEGSQGDFRIRFTAVDQADTFGVKVTTADTESRECDTVLTFINCTSGTSGAVDEIVFTSEQVNVVPNPVSQNATIELTINDQNRVRITLLDILGHQVAEISNRFMPAGTYKLPLEMSTLPAGTYYLRVQSHYGIVTKKIVRTN